MVGVSCSEKKKKKEVACPPPPQKRTSRCCLPEAAESTQGKPPWPATNTVSVRVYAGAKVLATKVLGIEERHVCCFGCSVLLIFKAGGGVVAMGQQRAFNKSRVIACNIVS